jgi:hypothetical protein
MDNTFNKDEHIVQYKDTMKINFPIDIEYVDEGTSVSAYAPIIDTYFYAKTIEELEHKAQGIIGIWIKYNLENHMKKVK